MLTALFAALVLQQAAASGGIVWETPVRQPVEEAQPSEAATAPDASISAPAPLLKILPDWALADPFAWERSQCSPLVRREPTQEACQRRVRTELTAALGDATPPELALSAVPEACVPAATGGGAYAVTCEAPQRTASSGLSTPADQVCERRPQTVPGGGVTWTEECRPSSGQAKDGGLSFKLFGRD